jgi:AbiV family abortive infection protein
MKSHFNPKNLSKISDLAGKKSKEYIQLADSLADKNLNVAYFLLVLAIEESSKAKVCMIYELFLKDPRNMIKINNQVVSKMFYSHQDKHITSLIQVIFDLTNTFDLDLKKRVYEAIKNKDAFLVPEITERLMVFKNIQDKRESAMYTNGNGDNDQSISLEEYNQLHRFAQQSIETLHSFTSYQNITYEDIQNSILEMLKSV